MIWITVFLTLTVMECVYIWLRWDKISQVIDVPQLTTDLLGNQLKQVKKFQKSMGIRQKILIFFLKYKKLIWLPILILLIVNVIISSVLSAFFSIIGLFI